MPVRKREAGPTGTGPATPDMTDSSQSVTADKALDPLPDEPRTDLGYARRLVYVHGDALRYVPEWRRWLVWTGRRWERDATGEASRSMKAIARRITRDALAGGDDAEIREARRGESAHAIAGALTLAGTEPGVVVAVKELDSDPFALNCANGTLDLTSMRLRPHDPADLLTKLTGCDYEPDAAGPQFDKFMERVQPDVEMRQYLARLLGHALEGRVTTHLLPIFCGQGANGKSTFVAALMAALGDYAAPADPDLLSARTFAAHPTGAADLFGLRLALLHETDQNRRLAEGTTKRLTGGDRIKVRLMRQDFWSFEPSHQFVMLTNHRPHVVGTDEGIWRRLRLVPWDVVVPAAEQDAELGVKLAAEAAAVLAWLVAGYRDWREGGTLAEPARVTAATAAYRRESDTLGRFLAQCCATGPRCTAGSTELYRAWSQWCDGEGVDPGSLTAFSTTLVERGFAKRHTRAGTAWSGLGLACDGSGGLGDRCDGSTA